MAHAPSKAALSAKDFPEEPRQIPSEKRFPI